MAGLCGQDCQLIVERIFDWGAELRAALSYASGLLDRHSTTIVVYTDHAGMRNR